MAKGNKKRGKEAKLVTDLSNKGIEIINFKRESVSPIISERIQKQKDWVFFGEDNLWPNELIRMADNSSLHSAILDTKAKMIAGDGIIFEGDEAKAENFLNEATEKWGGINKLIERISVDTAYFDSFYLNVQFNKGKQIGEIRHADYSFMRSGKMNDEGMVSDYFMSTRWDIATNKRVYAPEDEIYRPKEMFAFDPKKMLDKKSRKLGQIMVAKRYNPSTLYYSKPTYLGATNNIETSAKIANFHKNQLDNGMSGNLHLHLPQDLSDKNKRIKMLQALNDQYAGSNNAGRIFLTWGQGETQKPDLTPINTSDVHGALSELNERVNQEIVSAHQIPRQLAQLDLNTGFGGLELSHSLDLFQTMVISPSQQLVEDTLNSILKFNGIKSVMRIEKLKPSTLILDESLMKLMTTVDEGREIANLEPHPDPEIGDKLLIEIENGSGSDTTE